MNEEILTAIIETFVPINKQTRLLEFLWSERRYKQFLHELLRDPRNFNPKSRTLLPKGTPSVEDIYTRLRSLGADDEAYLVGDCPGYFDGTMADLHLLLESCVGCERDAMVYCPSAKVAYYEGNEGFSYILTPEGRKP